MRNFSKSQYEEGSCIHTLTKKGKEEKGDGGVMNWAIGIDMYTLMCVKLMTNKNLLYKKIK